jgi:hypothetical protein
MALGSLFSSGASMRDGRFVYNTPRSPVLGTKTTKAYAQLVGFKKFAKDDFFAFISMVRKRNMIKMTNTLLTSMTISCSGQERPFPFTSWVSANQNRSTALSNTLRLGYFGTYVGLTEKTANELDDATIARYTKGSKSLFTAWMCYATLIWSMKVVSKTNPKWTTTNFC